MEDRQRAPCRTKRFCGAALSRGQCWGGSTQREGSPRSVGQPARKYSAAASKVSRRRRGASGWGAKQLARPPGGRPGGRRATGAGLSLLPALMALGGPGAPLSLLEPRDSPLVSAPTPTPSRGRHRTQVPSELARKSITIITGIPLPPWFTPQSGRSA